MNKLIPLLLISFQCLAQPPTETQCTVDVESAKNVFQVCLDRAGAQPSLVLFRYLGSGEVAREEFPMDSLRVIEETDKDTTTSFIAKSLDDEELVRARNFARAPTALTK